jgi:hypothetical protein
MYVVEKVIENKELNNLKELEEGRTTTGTS